MLRALFRSGSRRLSRVSKRLSAPSTILISNLALCWDDLASPSAVLPLSRDLASGPKGVSAVSPCRFLALRFFSASGQHHPRIHSKPRHRPSTTVAVAPFGSIQTVFSRVQVRTDYAPQDPLTLIRSLDLGRNAKLVACNDRHIDATHRSPPLSPSSRNDVLPPTFDRCPLFHIFPLFFPSMMLRTIARHLSFSQFGASQM